MLYLYPGNQVYVYVHARVYAFMYLYPVTKCWLSGEKATESTQELCPESVPARLACCLQTEREVVKERNQRRMKESQNLGDKRLLYMKVPGHLNLPPQTSDEIRFNKLSEVLLSNAHLHNSNLHVICNELTKEVHRRRRFTTMLGMGDDLHFHARYGV